jgi:Phosphotransferase enzyme family
MHLTISNLAHFLIDRGLLSPGAIVAGDLVILESSRRNRNFKVIRTAGPGLFVKQIREMQPDAMLTLRREAACYDLARSDPALQRVVPRLIAYDPLRHVLILELVPEAESLAEYHARHRTFPDGIGRMLGEALGLYHACVAGIADDEAVRTLFPRQIPVVLTLERGGYSALGQYGRIVPALSAVIHQHPDFERLLDGVGNEWRFDSLIHGDLKWDNVLVFPAGGDRLDFRVVDWEMADFGDAAWDVGAVLQGALTAWIMSMPIASGLPPERYVAMASLPIEAMRPMLHAFWEAYSTTRGFNEAEGRSQIERCMRFGAARLVWAAIEQRLYAPHLDPAAAALLQVSFNILRDPPKAMAELLDL